jgi:hypothetical protein
MPTLASKSNEQSLQVVVAGPGDVAVMHVVSGFANVLLSANSEGPTESEERTFFVLVGPTITSAQFRRAIASAAIASLTLGGAGSSLAWSVSSVDADFDDESGQVRLTFDLKLAATGAVASMGSVGYQVTILTT